MNFREFFNDFRTKIARLLGKKSEFYPSFNTIKLLLTLETHLMMITKMMIICECSSYAKMTHKFRLKCGHLYAEKLRPWFIRHAKIALMVVVVSFFECFLACKLHSLWVTSDETEYVLYGSVCPGAHYYITNLTWKLIASPKKVIFYPITFKISIQDNNFS